MQEMNYNVVEDFLRDNPDFHIYNASIAKKVEDKNIAVNVENDFECENLPFIIKSDAETVTLSEVKDNDIYRIVKK